MGNKNSKSILDLNHDEAKKFFTKNENYCNLDLPSYINFSKVLIDASSKISKKSLKDLQENNPKHADNINHILLNNKDGKYCWRKFQLIHPVLYVFIVNEITKKVIGHKLLIDLVNFKIIKI